MTIVLTLLAGIIFGAINVAFFMVGYHFGLKKEAPNAITVDKNNQQVIEDMMRWVNYRG